MIPESLRHLPSYQRLYQVWMQFGNGRLNTDEYLYWPWTIFGVEWGLAVFGVIFKSFTVDKYEVASALVYLAQGWVAVVAVKPLIHSLGWHGLIWMGAGGVAYTLGIIFFALDRLRYFHALWHLFVLAGSVAHYFAILFYVVPVRP